MPYVFSEQPRAGHSHTCKISEGGVERRGKEKRGEQEGEREETYGYLRKKRERKKKRKGEREGGREGGRGKRGREGGGG